ncbi:MAG: 3-phosphoshikimate 1-carboxyvinyltransferase [Planctomycetes bacterium]|nr:3-phosphoshikimate 1-carboxyvinyltransferase [Planctomycetota bacterium]
MTGAARAVRPAVTGRALVAAVPGSKSLTNRWLMLAALAEGQSVLRGALASDDTTSFAEAIARCGVRASWTAPDELTVVGCAGAPRGGSGVNLGDGGTPTRFMAAFAALADRPIVIDGSARMRERPVAEGIAMLAALGAPVQWIESVGRLPVAVGGAHPSGSTLAVGATSSSQFISAVMLIAPWLDRGLELVFTEPPTSASYLELSIGVLARAGVPVSVERTAGGGLAGVTIEPMRVRGVEVTVEPDASSAIYPLAAAALVPGMRVTVPGLPRATAQPDRGAIEALVAMGAREGSVDGATVIEHGGVLRGITTDASRWPDGALAIAAVAAAASGTSTITGLHTLRVKESDRIGAMATELRALGCTVSATDDALVIDPSTRHDRPVTLHAHRDHRVAMSLATLGLARPGISIDDPACVAKSWPGFWASLALFEGV